MQKLTNFIILNNWMPHQEAQFVNDTGEEENRRAVCVKVSHETIDIP
jgi:hypothetical protein